MILAACGSDSTGVPDGGGPPGDGGGGDAGPRVDADPGAELGTTDDGALYYAPGCTGPDAVENVIVYLPGTNGVPATSSHIVRQVGRQSGLCVVAIPYANTNSVAACCTTINGQADAPQDAVCLTAIMRSKTFGVPASYTCTDGTRHTTPRELTIEASTLQALEDLERTEHVTGTGDARGVQWDRVAIAGHSQGAMLAAYLGMARHQVAAIGSLAGGALTVANTATGYLPYVTAPPMTEPRQHRAMHEMRDADAARRRVYADMGVPSENVRSVMGPPPCDTQPHPCIAVDDLIPLDGDTPVFAADWWWTLGGP